MLPPAPQPVAPPRRKANVEEGVALLFDRSGYAGQEDGQRELEVQEEEEVAVVVAGAMAPALVGVVVVVVALHPEDGRHNLSASVGSTIEVIRTCCVRVKVIAQ